MTLRGVTTRNEVVLRQCRTLGTTFTANGVGTRFHRLQYDQDQSVVGNVRKATYERFITGSCRSRSLSKPLLRDGTMDVPEKAMSLATGRGGLKGAVL